MANNICELCFKHIAKQDEVKKHYKGSNRYFHSKCWDKV